MATQGQLDVYNKVMEIAKQNPKLKMGAVCKKAGVSASYFYNSRKAIGKGSGRATKTADKPQVKVGAAGLDVHVSYFMEDGTRKARLVVTGDSTQISKLATSMLV